MQGVGYVRRAGAWSAIETCLSRSRFISDGAPRSLRAEVHMGDILLWAAVGLLFVAGALALLLG